jgi:hypothetical protein
MNTCGNCKYFLSFKAMSPDPEKVKGEKGCCFANQPQGFVFPSGMLSWERPVVHPGNKSCLDHETEED